MNINIIQIGLGAIVGAGLLYLYQTKKANKANNNEIYEENINNLTQQNSKLKNELAEVVNELESSKADNRNLRNQKDRLDDKSDDFELELTKLKKSNSNLAEEIEKLKDELNEYEMLYNARNQEVAELKQKLAQHGE